MANTTQKLNDIESINFDKDDQELFYVDDLRLKADALKHSVLPKLELMLNHAIAKIDEIYDVDIFQDSHITRSPNFRTKRKGKLKTDYNHCFCGLEGKRTKNKWYGLKRINEKEAQIIPFKFGFQLSPNGLRAILWNNPMQLTDETYYKYLDLINDKSDIISNFCSFSNFMLYLPSLLHTTQENVNWMKEHKKYYHHYETHFFTYPISSKEVQNIITDFAIFYFIYDTYLTIAKGEEIINTLWIKLHKWHNSEKKQDKKQKPKIDLQKAKEAAEQKVKVMPSLRWQVFQRDDWKCVSCGRSSHDNVILHMDHIVPRSKGGPDTLDNLQTLCWECNIGKSNKDDTDLRR